MKGIGHNKDRSTVGKNRSAVKNNRQSSQILRTCFLVGTLNARISSLFVSI
jgi:hypothetical protein